MTLSDLLLKYKSESVKEKRACVYIPLAGELRQRIKRLVSKVPADLLHPKGAEDDPHITALYGLTDDDPAGVCEVLSQINKPLPFRLGAVSVFERPEYDVLKVDVHSPALHILNRLLSRLPNDNEFPQYRPHVTLAFVHKGEGQQLAAKLGAVDQIGFGRTAVFSDSTKTKTRITLDKQMPDKYAQPIRYEQDRLATAFNEEFGKLADRLHSEKGVGDLDHFKGQNLYGYALKAAKGDPEQASDRLTNLLYGSNGVGQLEKAHKPNGTLTDRFKFLIRFQPKDKDLRNRKRLGATVVPVGDFVPVGKEDPETEALIRLTQQEQPKVTELPADLPADWRQIWLDRQAGRSLPEIAKEHNTSKQTIAARLKSILKRMQPAKYAAIKYETAKEAPAHPLVRGFQIEHFLRNLTNDRSLSADGRSLANKALTEGDTSALWPLNDELQETHHPALMSGYNLMSAVHKLHLDEATGTAINSIGRQQAEHNPVADVGAVEPHRIAIGLPPSSEGVGYQHIVGALTDLTDAVAGRPEASPAANETVSTLKGQGHSNEDLLQSIERHHDRMRTAMGGDFGWAKPEQRVRQSLSPKLKGDANRYRMELPERYRQSPALSDFIQAVRQLRSSNQSVRRSVVEQQYKKMKLDVNSIRDAISDAPHTASADTAHSIVHDGDMDKLRAAVSLIGLQLNSPSYLIFTPSDAGKDHLYKFDVAGSAEKLRRRMDAAGLLNRTLLPTETGWSATVYDAGGGMQDVVRQFAASEGVPLQHSVGTGEMLGGGDEAEGEKSSRKSFRSVVKSYERRQNANLSTQPSYDNSAPDKPAGAGSTAGGQPAYPNAGPTTTGPFAATQSGGTIA